MEKGSLPAGAVAHGATVFDLQPETCHLPSPGRMKPPPFLLGAALLFWGWQSGLLLPGMVMAAVLESARFVKTRWELGEEDLRRLWTFCALLTLGALVYAFTANDGPSNFSTFIQNPNPATQGGAGVSTSRTSAALIRWLPMLFFLFVAAQAYNTRDTVPLAAISLIHRRRRLQARRRGQPPPPEREVPVGYPYFAVCLLGASVHAPQGGWFDSFYWGLCGLLAWALWAQRSRRFSLAVWAGALLIAIGLGFAGQRGVAQLLGVLQNLNVQWLAQLMRPGTDADQSRTALGRIGELKLSPRIVVRLQVKEGSEPPEYLREASYRTYGSEIWRAGGGTNGFDAVSETAPDSATWVLVPGKTNLASVRIASYLNGWKDGTRAGLLPLPRTSGQLEQLRAFTLEKNATGSVLATGPGLVVFDALYGPGAAMDSPAVPVDDLSVPDRERPVLRQVAADWQLDANDLAQTLRTLHNQFADNFTYSTWQGRRRFSRTNDTPLTRFLLKTRRGHCEYFATATVLLLRQAGFPARYAVGYAVHEGSGRKYVVRQRDAHAWCLVWDAQRGEWLDFDTTPASWIEAERAGFSPWLWVSDAWSRLRYEFAKVWWGQTNLRQYLLWSLVPMLAVLLFQILFRRGRRRRPSGYLDGPTSAVWPGLDSEFYLLEQRLAGRGVPREMGEPLSDWLERAARATGREDLRPRLRDLLRLHYRYRFDPPGLSESDRAALREGVRACQASLDHGADRHAPAGRPATRS